MASAPDCTPLPHMISPMTEVEGRSALSPEVGTTRVEAFSDSVMAVIITIMAFELRPPQGASLDAMRDQLPGVLVYMLSFVFVGIYWNNHHHLLRAADRISGAAMWANLFLLFWLSLIPVLTEWVRDQYLHALPTAAYGMVGLAAGCAYPILVRTLIQATGPHVVGRGVGGEQHEPAQGGHQPTRHQSLPQPDVVGVRALIAPVPHDEDARQEDDGPDAQHHADHQAVGRLLAVDAQNGQQ